MTLSDFITANSERGECRCGRCVGRGGEKALPEHTANMVFFDVALKGAVTADELRAVVKGHRGAFCECDPFDGKEHSYLELGGWVGDQGLALQLMGMGSLLKVWDLLTPYTVLGSDTPEGLAMTMAGSGFVIIQRRD